MPRGPRETVVSRGVQVRVPISELKSWLEAKLDY